MFAFVGDRKLQAINAAINELEFPLSTNKNTRSNFSDYNVSLSTNGGNFSQNSSNAGNVTLADDELPSEWVVVSGIVCGIIISLLGMIGNGMTIAAYRRNRKLRTSFNFLITNLCAVDLVFSAVIIPTHLPMMFTMEDVYGEYGCGTVGYLYYSSMSSSAINLVCIAINRYVGIVHSRRYRYMFGRDYAKYWIIGICISAPLLYLPLLITRSIRWRSSSLRCDLISKDESTSIAYYQIGLNVLLQLIPTLALIVFYRAILKKVKKCRKTVEHYPITNTPSNATSACISPGHECYHSMHSRHRSSYPRSPTPSMRGPVVAGDVGDVREGKKAIIMAYLQVPPAAVSPRKGTSTLYKRSPPQTRTMVVEEAEGIDKNQVLISGTTSSPDLARAKVNSEEASPTTVERRSRMRWRSQRSFSVGDEEIEPEPGMIGDVETDLPQMKSFEIGRCIRNSHSESSDDDDEISKQIEDKIKHSSKIHSEENEEKSSNISTREIFLDTSATSENPVDVDMKQCEKGSMTSLAKNCIGVHRVNITTEVESNTVIKMRQSDQTSLSSCESEKRKSRTLTRQSVVDDEELHTIPIDKIALCEKRPNMKDSTSNHLTSETSFEKKRTLTNAVENTTTLSPPERDDFSCSYIPSPGDEKLLCVSTPPPSGSRIPRNNMLMTGDARRARFAFKHISSSSDKGYVSQIDPVYSSVEKSFQYTVNANENNALQQRTTPTVRDDGLYKRIMFRRGASDGNGMHWFKHFRKSKNFSLTSLKRSKYRVRSGTSGARKDAVIKIVIDHVEETEDVSQEGDVFSPTLKSNPQKIVSGTTTHGNDKVLDEKQNDIIDASIQHEKTSKLTRVVECCRDFWKVMFHENKLAQGNSKLVAVKQKVDHNKKDEGVGSSAESSGSECSKSKHDSRKSSLWSGVEVSAAPYTIQNSVMLPIPILPAPPHKTDEENSSGDIEKRMCKTPLTFIDGDEQREDAACTSGDTSSRRGSKDTDVISPHENDALLAKRRRMNNSSQFLRVQNININADCEMDKSGVGDLSNVNLCRRWSGQSDVISIYSGKCSEGRISAHGLNITGSLVPPKRSSIISVCSQMISRHHSKKSEGSGTSSRAGSKRKPVYKRWASSIASSLGSSTSRRKRREAERKLAYSGVFICIAFAACVLPTSVVDIIQNLTDIYIMPNVRFSVFILSWLHVVANPILYGFLNSQYRIEYRKILADLRRCLRCHKSGIQSGRSAIVKKMRELPPKGDGDTTKNNKKRKCSCIRRS